MIKERNLKMWNPSKSVKVSSICTKIMILLVICFGITTPVLVKSYVGYTLRNPDIIPSLIITIYACIVPGLGALFCLDRLLFNIKTGEVFIGKNVNFLRIISWCCFAVSIILAVSGIYYLLFIMIAIAAAFFGLIIRVVKNVIEEAMIIKNENDFTI